MKLRPLALLVAPLGLVALVGASAAPGCHGATEISVAVTTTVPCSPTLKLTTQIFTGATGTTDFGAAPAAETDACGPAEPRVGTLSVVPSGARDDRFDLEVVGAVGVQASDCQDASRARDAVPPGTPFATKTTGCVVAKRRLSFRPHRALTMTVRLDAKCVGVMCGVDQTCDVGVCTPTASCTDQGCPRELADDAGPGPSDDAGADVSVDAPADVDVDASRPRCTTTPEKVITDSVVGRLVQDGSDFVYVSRSGQEIHRVPRSGAAVPQIIPPGLTSPTHFVSSLAARSSELAWAENATSGTTALVISADGGPLQRASVSDPSFSTHNETHLTFSTTSVIVGFWQVSDAGPDTRPFTFRPSASAPSLVDGLSPLQATVTKVLADDLGDFYGIDSAALHHYTVAPGTYAPTEAGRLTMSNLGTITDFANAGETFYVGLFSTTSANVGIYQIARGAINDNGVGHPSSPWIQTQASPHTITSDGTTVFYFDARVLMRADIPPASSSVMPKPVPVTTVAPPAEVTSLEVDDRCVYWVERDNASTTTIMKRSKVP